MAKTQPLKKSLADEIVEQPFTRPGSKSWLTYLPEQTVKELEEVRRRLHAREGKYQYASALELAGRLKDTLKLHASKHVIRRWLAERE